MEIQKIREENKSALRKGILDAASQLLTEEGPNAFSMRKLAKKIGA
ncbi:TetR family transcriptional regulator [Deltaproteobacteria bacterium TL4]